MFCVTGDLYIVFPCPHGNQLEKDPQNPGISLSSSEKTWGTGWRPRLAFHCLLLPTFCIMGLVLYCMFKKK